MIGQLLNEHWTNWGIGWLIALPIYIGLRYTLRRVYAKWRNRGEQG